MHKAVIDTGPLLSALVLHYQAMRGSRPSFQSFLEDPLLIREQQEQFLDMLAAIREKLTTSHVVAELQGLAKARLKLSGDDRLGFWRNSIELLVQWNLDEQLIRLLDLASREEAKLRLPEIGIVDAGLIELAARDNCPLITNDGRLAGRALADHVDCQLVKQLIPPV